MLNDDYMRIAAANADENLGLIRETVNEIRDLLRTERANPTPEPTAEERLIDVCNTLAIDNIISAGRARELSGQPIMEQRAWFRAHKEEINSESDREAAAILRVRSLARESEGGQQARLRVGAEDGGRTAVESRDDDGAAQATGGEGLLRPSADPSERGIAEAAKAGGQSGAGPRSGGQQRPRAEGAEQRQTVYASPANALRVEMRHHGLRPSGIAPDVLDSIAAAVAHVRDRQTVAWLRREAAHRIYAQMRGVLEWAADRIEAGVVDDQPSISIRHERTIP